LLRETLLCVTQNAYLAPVGEYSYLINHVVGAGEVLDRHDLAATDVSHVLAQAGTLAAEVLAPLNAEGDRAGSRLVDGSVRTPDGFAKAFAAFVDGGWLGVRAPKEVGGDGLPRVLTIALEEFWSGANMALALCPGLTAGGIAALHASADEQVRELYLPHLVAGRWTATMDLTEPQAGTYLADIRTIARPEADGTWSVTGQKIFITWGDHDLTENIVHLVLARTPDAPAGLGGLSLFAVGKHLSDAQGRLTGPNAVRTVSLEHKLGIHASPTCVLDYDGATGHLVGPLHQGVAAMFVMMNFARLGIAAQALGVADRAFQAAEAYAGQRVQGPVIDRPAGTSIAEHPDVRRLLVSMRSRLAAMRALVMQVASWLDAAAEDEDPQRADQAGRLAEFFVPVLKGWLSETAVRVASDAIQVHGGSGFIEETGAAQFYRDIRILPIYEGTTAIQANDLIGRKLLRDRGRTATAVLELIDRDRTALAEIDHPAARRVADGLGRAVEATRHATDALLAFGANTRDIYAGSVPYLELLGVLAGGWMHARTLRATLSHPAIEADSVAARRVRDAEFYAAHHLSTTSSLSEAVQAGEIA
jgi:alkylation response protein AidB-like acyl-CoA dehydrogenase